MKLFIILVIAILAALPVITLLSRRAGRSLESSDTICGVPGAEVRD